MHYTPLFEPEWKWRFEKLDNSIKLRITKKVKQIINGLPGRHLKRGLPYFVEEVDQYRICYSSLEEAGVRRFYFVGTHKEYMKWVQRGAPSVSPTELKILEQEK